MKRLFIAFAVGVSLIAIGVISGDVSASMYRAEKAEKVPSVTPVVSAPARVRRTAPSAVKWKGAPGTSSITSKDRTAILAKKRTPISTWKDQKISAGANVMSDGKVRRAPAGNYKGVVTDVIANSKGKVIAIAIQAMADGNIQSEFPIEGAFMEGPVMIKRSGLDRITKVRTNEGNTYYNIDGNWYNNEGRGVSNSQIVDEGVSDVSFVYGDTEMGIRNQITGDAYVGTTWEESEEGGATGYGGEGGADSGSDTEFEMDIV